MHALHEADIQAQEEPAAQVVLVLSSWVRVATFYWLYGIPLVSQASGCSLEEGWRTLGWKGNCPLTWIGHGEAPETAALSVLQFPWAKESPFDYEICCQIFNHRYGQWHWYLPAILIEHVSSVPLATAIVGPISDNKPESQLPTEMMIMRML